MSNGTRCDGRNGTYVCELVTGHGGEHMSTFWERGTQRRARWASAWGEMRFTRPAGGAKRFPNPNLHTGRKWGAL